MKTFITSLFLLFTIGLFAQPQKGDLYVGFSNLRFSNNTITNDNGFSSLNRSTFSMSPLYGKFVADNTLVGGGFSFFTSLSDLSSGDTNINLFGLNLLVAQYFGKGKLKGLSQVSFNSNLISNEFSNVKRSINGNLGLGGAYFLNEFTSVQLLYRINLFSAIEGNDIEYFVNDLNPNIGLSIRTFLLRNREGIENLSALNTIKQGTKTLNLTAGILNNDEFYSHSYGGAFNYFFVDNFYGNIGLSSFLNKNNERTSRFSSFNLSLNLGYYLAISEDFYIKLGAGIETENRFSQFNSNNIEIINTDTHIRRLNTELGTAIFLGRHKLEPGIGFRMSGTKLKQLGDEVVNDFSPSIFINYEWLLAGNFAFSTNLNYQINNVSYFVFSSNSPFIESEIFEIIQNNLSLNVGFKWYLSTPTN